MPSNKTEVFTTEVGNYLLANGHNIEAKQLFDFLSSAKEGDTLAINNTIDMLSVRWLGDLNISTLRLTVWYEKLLSLRNQWIAERKRLYKNY